MKKLWSMLLVVTMLCGMFAVPTEAADYNEYSEYIGAMGEAFDNGYEYIYDGHSLKDAPYEWSNSQYGTDMLNSVWWDIKPNDDEVNRVKNSYNFEEFRCIYDKELLEQVINFKFNLSVDEIAEMANKDVSNSIIQKGNYWMALTYGRGERWPGCELYVDEFEKLNESTAYAVWHYENPYDYYSGRSNTHYAILEKGIIAGKEMVGYRYFGTTPPSEELLAQYGGNHVEGSNLNNEYEHIPIDGFDQSEDSLEQWFVWLPMDTYNKQTYHDILEFDFSRAFHELIIPFDVGVVSESKMQEVVSKNNLPTGSCKGYYLNEIQQTFNAVYNTDIDMASLDGLTMDGHVLVRVIDNYFIVIQGHHGTDVNPNPKGGCKIGANSYYWIWYYQDEWNTNDLIYTIISYKNIAGYDVRSIDYIGFEPPTDEQIARYKQPEITVTLNGNKLQFDQPPILRNDRTLVPMRAIFEALGAEVKWNDDTQTVTAIKGNTLIKITIGEKCFYKNGKKCDIDVAAILVNDRTLVPVRAISEALSCKVDWDESAQNVIIKSGSGRK